MLANNKTTFSINQFLPQTYLQSDYAQILHPLKFVVWTTITIISPLSQKSGNWGKRFYVPILQLFDQK
jgi:hypothetical protein